MVLKLSVGNELSRQTIAPPKSTEVLFMKRFLFGLLFISFFQVAGAQNYTYPFKDPAVPVDERVDDLLSKLNLQEKADLIIFALMEQTIILLSQMPILYRKLKLIGKY